MAGWLGEKPHAVVDRAALRVARAVIHPPQPRERDRARAHRARFQRHIEVAAGQPFAADQRRRGAQRQHFGVGGGVAVGQGAVAGGRDDHAIPHDHAADRHFAGGLRRAGSGERLIHECGRGHVWTMNDAYRRRCKAAIGCSPFARREAPSQRSFHAPRLP